MHNLAQQRVVEYYRGHSTQIPFSSANCMPATFWLVLGRPTAFGVNLRPDRRSNSLTNSSSPKGRPLRLASCSLRPNASSSKLVTSTSRHCSALNRCAQAEVFNKPCLAVTVALLLLRRPAALDHRNSSARSTSLARCETLAVCRCPAASHEMGCSR